MARKSKIKNCIVVNPPTTPQEQEEYDRQIARALAECLYRALGPKKIDILLEQYKKERKEAV